MPPHRASAGGLGVRVGRAALRPGSAARPEHVVAAHDGARGDDVSWASLIRTARVAYGFQTIVALGLLLPPQMRDMLAALTETRDPWEILAFPASLAVFGFLSWYWARAAISARFDLPDRDAAWEQALEEARQGKRPYLRRAPLHIVPQAPIPLAGIMGLLLAIESGAVALGIVSLLFLLLVWYGVQRRRTVHAWLRALFFPGYVFRDEKLPAESVRLRSTYSVRIWLRRAPFRFMTLLRRAPSGIWPASALLVVSMAVFLVTSFASFFPAHRLDDARNAIWTSFTGPTPVLLGCALMVGPFTALSFVLDGWRPSLWLRGAPISLRRPPVLAGLLAVSVLVPDLVRLHTLRTVPGPLPRRPALTAFWQAWRTRCGADTRPVIVSVSGGAARAALWGAAVLAEIDAATEGAPAAVFAISTVSGGSLGAALYLSARQQEREAPPGPAGCRLDAAARERFGPFARDAAAADAIGPLLAGVVLSDTPRGLFGWLPALAGANMAGGDRAAAIERAFETNALRAAHTSGMTATELDRPFLSLTGPGLPLWIAQATERDSGTRALITSVRGGGAGMSWPFRGASDVLALLGTDMPISTVVNATARFPFLEPPGQSPPGATKHRPLNLIDGGYYDNSGMESAQELADWLRTQGANPILVAATGSGYGDGLSAMGQSLVADDVVRCFASEFQPDQPPPGSTFADVLGPLIGLYQVRAGHMDALLRRARAAYCTAPYPAFYHFYLGARGAEPVPLNWVLSRGMARHVWLSAGNGDPGREAHDVFVRANRCEAARLAGTVRSSPIMPGSCHGLPGFGPVVPVAGGP